MAENIRECPFCGSRDVSFVDDWYEEGDEHMTVYCNNCHAMLRPEERPRDSNDERYEPGDEAYDELEERMVETWNRRDNVASLSTDLIKISEELLKECKSLGNVKLSDAFIQNLMKLSEKIEKIKDQQSREKLVIRDADTTSRRIRAERRHDIDPISGVDFATTPAVEAPYDSPEEAIPAEAPAEAAPFVRSETVSEAPSSPTNLLDEIIGEADPRRSSSCPWDEPIAHITRSTQEPESISISSISSASSHADNIAISIPSASATTGVYQARVRETIPDPYRDMIPTRPDESRSRDDYVRAMIDAAVVENTTRTFPEDSPGETVAPAERPPRTGEPPEGVPTEAVRAALASYQEAMGRHVFDAPF